MCGIAGVIGADAVGGAARLGQAVAHRGPDGSGLQAFALEAGLPLRPAGGIALVHRRLAILDPRAVAAQPMATPDGRHWLVYNGEIYNFRELRDSLERNGERFATNGDSEVLLRLLARDGISALDRLEGMWAFAWLDRQERRLVLARDHLGIKPLYVAEAPGRFAFASEIPALLSLPWVGRSADPIGVADYLIHSLTDHRPGTCLSDIRQVPGGHLLTVPVDDPGHASSQRWYFLPPPPRSTHNAPAADELAEALARSVSSHLLSDRLIGTALSGGLDSSAVVSLARRALGPGGMVEAVGYCADDPLLGEERWMEMAATAANARLHRIRIDEQDLAADLDDLVRCQGEPFGSTSIHAQYRVMRAAAGHGLSVMLGGQGADELFAGYSLHLATRAAELLLQGDVVGAMRVVAGSPGLHWRSVAGQLLGSKLPPRLPPWIRGGALGPGSAPFREPLGPDLLRRRLREALLSTNLPMLLRYEDRNAMRWGIENRVPFLHRPLVELATRFPAASLVARDGRSKAVLREALRGIIPNAILLRRDKIGFAAPEAKWMVRLSAWVERTIAEAGSRPAFLDLEAFRRHWRLVADGSRPYTPACWRTLNLLRWADLGSIRL